MSPDPQLFLPWLLAHALGDFIFQTNRDVAGKRQPLIFGKHLLLHGLLAYLLAAEWSLWQPALLITASHGLVDWLKLSWWERRWQGWVAFAVDQGLHLALLWLLASLWPAGEPGFWVRTFGSAALPAFAVAAAVVLVTRGAGVFVGLFVQPIAAELADTDEDQGLREGGKWIGYLERLIILMLFIAGEPGAVGWLITAKSIFRFGETQRSRRTIEYILIGTLLSFVLGMAISWSILHGTDALPPQQTHPPGSALEHSPAGTGILVR